MYTQRIGLKIWLSISDEDSDPTWRNQKFKQLPSSKSLNLNWWLFWNTHIWFNHNSCATRIISCDKYCPFGIACSLEREFLHLLALFKVSSYFFFQRLKTFHGNRGKFMKLEQEKNVNIFLLIGMVWWKHNFRIPTKTIRFHEYSWIWLKRVNFVHFWMA